MIILVTGCQHCGTTILQKLIGSAEGVFYVQHELSKPEHVDTVILPENYSFVVVKNPDFLNECYIKYKGMKNLKVVSIVRDPRDVYLSLCERWGPVFNWEIFKHMWIPYCSNVVKFSFEPNGYMLRYEDMFDSDHMTIKNLFNWIGIPFDEEILENKKTVMLNDYTAPNDRPPRTEQLQFRLWQIHQPFEQKSGRWKTVMSEETLKLFDEPEIKILMNAFGYD